MVSKTKLKKLAEKMIAQKIINQEVKKLKLEIGSMSPGQYKIGSYILTILEYDYKYFNHKKALKDHEELDIYFTSRKHKKVGVK